jgi:PAS domain S-box-containing protein
VTSPDPLVAAPPASFEGAVLDALFEHEGMALCLLDPAGRVRRASGAWLQSTGLVADEVIGRGIWEIFPETPPELRRLHDEVRAGRTVAVPPHRQLVAGREVWYEGTLVPVPLVNGVGVLVTARDITERTHARERVRRNNAVLGAVARVFQEALTCATLEALGRACLALAEDMTQSRYGFIGMMDAKTGIVEQVAMSDPAGTVLGGAAPPGEPPARVVLSIHGLCGRALLDGRAFFTHDLAPSDPAGAPAGRPAPRAFLGVPLSLGAMTLGVLGLADRAGGYSTSELEMIEALAPAIVQAFQSKRAELALRDREELLRMAVSAGRMVAWSWTAQDDRLEATDNFREILGRPLPGSSAERWAGIHPEDRDRHRATVEEAVRTGTPYASEYRIERLDDGRTVWLNERGEAEHDEAGRLRRVVGISQDVTERRGAQERLAAEHAVLARFHELSARLLEEDDLATLLQAVVDAAIDLTGAAKGTLQLHDPATHALRIVAHRGFEPAFLQHFAVVQEGAAACGEALRRRERVVVEEVTESPIFAGTPAGAVLQATGVCALQSTPVVARDGSVLGTVSTHWTVPHRPDEMALRVLDLLAREAAHLIEHRRREEALRDADRRKNEFIGVLSHELRNPLAPIRNGLLLLERAPPGGEQARRAREVMLRQTEHLTRLVDDLLDVTRISRGKIALKRAVMDLREVALRARDDHAAMFSSRGIDLQLEAPAAPLVVNGDAVRLAQVLGNLLHNAAKFTGAGGRVWLAVEEVDGRAVVRVRDTGMGIAPGELERIFEPFAQTDRSLARVHGGLGLGLSLVRGIVGLHGGTVAARSDGPGRGAEFVVSLPLAAAPTAPHGRPPDPKVSSRGRSVVIIEDNDDAARTLAEVLALSGHSVRIALDGRSGIELARAVAPDFVICDLGLPDLDGFEVARALRADGRLGATRLVALSGYAQAEDRERAREAGFDAHLPKPAVIEQLDALLSAG